MYININGLKQAALALEKAKKHADLANTYCIFNDVPYSLTCANTLKNCKIKVIDISNSIEKIRILLNRKINDFENAENRNTKIAYNLGGRS